MRLGKIRTFDIRGQSVRCIETDDGERTWLCECAQFKERAARYEVGFCDHTIKARWRRERIDGDSPPPNA